MVSILIRFVELLGVTVVQIVVLISFCLIETDMEMSILFIRLFGTRWCKSQFVLLNYLE